MAVYSPTQCYFANPLGCYYLARCCAIERAAPTIREYGRAESLARPFRCSTTSKQCVIYSRIVVEH